MTEERLEKPFNPSSCTPRGTSSEVLAEFCDLSQKQSKLAVDNCRNELGVSYGKKENQILDVFYPDDCSEETGVVVFFHGGYWQEGSTASYRYVAFPITKVGKICVLVGKVLAPHVSVTEIVEQCAQAMTFICQRFPSASSLTISGHSSGGHECAMMLSRNWLKTCPAVDRYFTDKLERVVLLCGVFELTHLIDTEVNDALKLTREEAKLISPLECVDDLAQNVKRFDCKVVLVTVENDAITINNWNKVYSEALKSKGVDADIIFLPELDHFNMVTNMIDSEFSVSKLLTV